MSPAAATDDAPSPGPPQVLCMGMLRTGTFSLAGALEILGFRTFHALNLLHDKEMWRFIERAAEATWPEVASTSPPPKPFGRADWDEYFARWDALADIAVFFAPQLIAAYPEAKVVLTTRDFDRWLPSYDSRCLREIMTPRYERAVKTASYFIGNRALFAMQKVIRGYYGIGPDGQLEGAQAGIRQRWDAHYARVRAIVPPERLLEFEVGRDGWEPLCEFLGRPVPEVGFPRLNDRVAHQGGQEKTTRDLILKGAMLAVVYASPVLVAFAAWWYWQSSH